MLNSFFVYSTIDKDSTWTVSDASFTYSIPQSIIDSNSSWFYYKKLDDDIKLETIAYFEYGDTKYWDLIVELNKMPTFYSLPKNQNIISAQAEASTIQWGIDFGYDLTLPQYNGLYNQKYSEYAEQYFNENEIYRYIKLVKVQNLPDLKKAVADDTSS